METETQGEVEVQHDPASSVPVQQDYFGADAPTYKVFLPDGISYVEHQKLMEGARRQYLNATNRKVRLQRQTGDAVMDMAAGDDRHHLLKTAIVDWNLKSKGEVVPFSKKNLEQFLEKADPSVMDTIEKDIRNRNKWLLADVSIEDIDSQIKELEELRQEKLAEQEGKGF